MPMSPRPSWLLFAALFAVDCAVHVLTFSLGPGPVVLDAEEYWVGAGDVAAGDWLQRSGRLDYRTPLYPMFVAVPRRFCGEYAHMAVVISQHVLLLCANGVTAFICWRVSRNGWAALAGYALAVLSLTRAWYANLVLTEALFTLLLTAAVGALVEYHQRPTVGRSAVFGLFLGLTILVRPVPQWLWPLLLLLFFLHGSRGTCQPRRFPVILQHAVVAATVIVLLCTPWCARNWAMFGQPFLARLPAENKWLACFQHGSGGGLPIPDDPAGRRLLDLIGTPDGDVPDRSCHAVIVALRDKGLSKEDRDQLVAAVCRAAIREHPGRFSWAAFKRFVNFWRSYCRRHPVF